jgi:hypothetical protein
MLNEKQIIVKAILESNCSNFVAVCQEKECKQLIMLEGGCEFYGYMCDSCGMHWCDKHENTAEFKCKYCGWAICSTCCANNRCSICGVISNHQCEWSQICNH